jgi:membrane-associated phospholipid phosphatase
VNSFLSDVRGLFAEARAAVRARPVIFFVAMPVAMIAAAAFFFPRDVAISDWVYRDRSELARDFARRFSAYADFRLAAEFFAVFWLVGVWKKRRDWQRLGLAILLATSLAGAFDSAIRLSTGRPRPSANKPDHFTGPQLTDHYMQSFPSAHSATSMATAGVIAVAMPEVGIPFFILSLGVPWSRVYMHDHYVSDVTVGGLIGLWFGIAFGLAHRKFQ